MPASEVTLRYAKKSDALSLQALATQVFLETYATAGIHHSLAREVDQHCGASAFLTKFEDPSIRIAVAQRDAHMIAFSEVKLDVHHPLVRTDRSAELARLYVQSPFLRQGIGALLLRHAEGLAAAAGASTLWLTAWVGNRRALAFYASQGYEELGTTEYVFENERFENRLFARALPTEPRTHHSA